jgi:L-alanine-DL-glutamate epimerase-like enolase superfamily enzyme
LTWIEEPIVYDNFDGFAQLATELSTPIQIAENFYGPRELYDIKAGYLQIPSVPGIGVDWNEDAVADHLADIWP